MKRHLPLLTVALLLMYGCGGGVVVDGDPGPGVSYINWNFSICAAANHQTNSDCVFAEGIADEYFVVWEDIRSGTDYDLYGRFYDRLRAEPASTELQISIASEDQVSPKVAYNTISQEILVVWEDYYSGNSDIYGQFVDAATGTLLGSNFAISTALVDERAPRVVYNPNHNEYFVTWDESNGSDLDVMGTFVSASGSLSAVFVLTPVAGDQQSAVAALDPLSDRYLVVFMDFVANPLESDLYGQFVDYDGGLLGSDFVINDDAYNQDFPDIVYNEMQDIFLVAWEDDQLGDWDITAQLVEPDGTLFDLPFIITPNIANQQNCRLTYNDYWGEYLVVWEDSRLGGADIFGQGMTSNAIFIGGNTVINDYAVPNMQPAVCSNGLDREFLVTWSSLVPSGHYDIKGQLTFLEY